MYDDRKEARKERREKNNDFMRFSSRAFRSGMVSEECLQKYGVYRFWHRNFTPLEPANYYVGGIEYRVCHCFFCFITCGSGFGRGMRMGRWDTGYGVERRDIPCGLRSLLEGVLCLSSTHGKGGTCIDRHISARKAKESGDVLYRVSFIVEGSCNS